MDRVIVYDGALPQVTDILNTNKFAMVGRSFMNAAVLGTSTVVAGLACTPTTPTADLNVHVAVGSIFQQDPTDATAYGDLGIDTAVIMKQGLLQTAQTLAITPPGTAGFSQVYLIQAILNDVDTGTQTLSYYDSANPAAPYSGPGNSGSSNFTIRACKCVIALKAGTPAATGSQVAPSPDAGYVGLYTVTVANGQTQITSSNIAQLSTAPFFPTLPSVPASVQNQGWVYAGTDTGAANAYVITFVAGQPVPTSYKTGMKVSFKALNTNTGASTINVNGLGTVAIRRATGVALAAGDITTGGIVELTYDGTNFQMANYLGTGTTSNTSTVVDIPYVADSGTQNAIVATFSPSLGSLVDGTYVGVKLANAITGACTLNANGLGAKPVVLGDGTNPPYNVFVAGEIVLFVYSTAMASWQIANTTQGMFYRRPTANYTIYVNTATGSDSLYDGTSATVGTGTAGPLKTINKAIQVAWGYAPSQFSITIQIAAGTYNENVATPSYAGPYTILNGVATASVTINGGNGHCVVCQGPNTMLVQNLTIQNNGVANTHGFEAASGATLFTYNTASNGITGGHVFEGINGGTVYPAWSGSASGTHTFNGSCNACFAGEINGTCYFQGGSFVFSTSISVSATATADGGSVWYNALYPVPTFTNPSFVNGSKYFALTNGSIGMFGLGFNFFPGTVAGSTQTGGQYQP